MNNKVVRLVPESNEDTVEFIECMLVLAQSGELSDISATYTRSGAEHIGLTGRYRVHPAEAVRAAFRMISLLARPAHSTGTAL